MSSNYILARSKDEEILKKAAVGGAVTGILQYLLDNNIIDGVLTLKPEDDIYDGIPMDGSRLVDEIQSGKIELKTVKKINVAAYTDYIDRIRSLFCIDTIIKNCEYLYYPDGKIPKSDIKVTYLLLKGLDGKNLHLGIDTYRRGRPYFTRTLLVTEENNAKKFIDKAEEKLKVAKLEIRDKDTNEVIEVVKRQEAVVVARKQLDDIVEKWIKTEFEDLIENFMTQPEQVDKIENYWKNRDDNDVDSNEYMQFLQGSITRAQKNIWAKLLHSQIEKEKKRIRKVIEKLDPYWSGKIMGEEIRMFEKKEGPRWIQKKIDSYLENEVVRIRKKPIENIIEVD